MGNCFVICLFKISSKGCDKLGEFAALQYQKTAANNGISLKYMYINIYFTFHTRRTATVLNIFVRPWLVSK